MRFADNAAKKVKYDFGIYEVEIIIETYGSQGIVCVATREDLLTNDLRRRPILIDVNGKSVDLVKSKNHAEPANFNEHAELMPREYLIDNFDKIFSKQLVEAIGTQLLLDTAPMQISEQYKHRLH